MKKYKVIVTPKAQQDLKEFVDYIKNKYKNPQAAQSLLDDFVKTRKALSMTAGSIKESEIEKLKQAGLKRINFRKHRYFLLFRMDDDAVRITNVFCDLQDYENKLNEW